jgi:hypothetical protein
MQVVLMFWPKRPPLCVTVVSPTVLWKSSSSPPHCNCLPLLFCPSRNNEATPCRVAAWPASQVAYLLYTEERCFLVFSVTYYPELRSANY